MRCLVCGSKCQKQMALDGKKAPKYPNLCPECNKRRKSEILIMSKDGTRYAFVPTSRMDGEKNIEMSDITHSHPRNFWLVPEAMIPTVIEKIYPLTDDEKRIKEQISRLREERELLDYEIGEIEGKIEELEQELDLNLAREIKRTWLLGISPEMRAEIL